MYPGFYLFIQNVVRFHLLLENVFALPSLILYAMRNNLNSNQDFMRYVLYMIFPLMTNFSSQKFFNQVLMLGKTSISDLSEHVFDLILELYNIDSHLLLSVLPQLEFKLKVTVVKI